MLYRVIRREGFKVNHKRVERRYREEGLSRRRRRRPKRLSHLRVARERRQALNHTWAVDFVHDGLFNSRLREECLNEQVFVSLDDARRKIEQWRVPYNCDRPPSSLGYLAPAEFAASHEQTRSETAAQRGGLESEIRQLFVPASDG